MADETTSWTGAVSGQWDLDGNWTGNKPSQTGDNDTLILLKTAINAPTINLDRTGDNTSNGQRPRLLYIEPGTPYDIGASGNPLKIKAMKVVHKGDGTLFLESAGATEQTDDIIINSPNLTNAAQIDDNGTTPCARIAVTRGKVTLAAGMLTIAKLEIAFAANPATDSIVVIGTHATNVITQLIMAGGSLVSDMGCLNVVMMGGLAEITQGDVTKLIIGAGTFTYKVSGGTIEDLFAIGGVTDMLSGEATPKTITNLHKYPSAQVIRDIAEQIITVDNLFEYGIDVD